MNILLLRDYNPFVENGASANRFRGLVEGLRYCGVNLDIAVVGGVVKPTELKENNQEVKYLSKSNRYSYWQARLNKYIFNNMHKRIAKRRFNRLDLSKYDYIWLSNSSSVFNVFFSSDKSTSCKTFIELNEFQDIHKEEGHAGNILQRIYGSKSEKSFIDVVSKIDYFACMTNTLLDHYRKMAKPEAKFIHLPMTVDLKRFIGIPDTTIYSKPYIAYTGTFNNAKDGVDVLIKSFAKIANKYPQYHLYLAGFWHYDVPMQEKLIEEFGLTNRITYLGVLNKDQIPVFVCNADLLVLSRPDSHQAQGGFPTKLGEYLATGNPVCVTKVGEIPDYLEDNVSAFMATPGDVDSFADAMDRALSNPDNAKKVGLAGREVAEREFNSEIQAKRLYEFLQENL